MSGGGRQHRAPIPIPDEVRATPSNETQDFEGEILDTADYQPGSGMGAVVMNHFVTAMLLVMAVAFGTWAYLTFKDAEAGKLLQGKERPFESQALDAQADRVHFALSVYLALYGSYPPELDALVEEGLLQPSDLEYPPGPASIVYERVGDAYQLSKQRVTIDEVEAEAATGAATEPAEPAEPAEAVEAAPKEKSAGAKKDVDAAKPAEKKAKSSSKKGKSAPTE